MGRPVRTLVVGRREIPEATPDALGPKVLEHSSRRRRHLELGMGRILQEARVSGLKRDHAGVMAQTGMEAAEIVKGIVQETEPDAVIVNGCVGGEKCRGD